MAGLKKMENAKKTVIYLDEVVHKAVKHQALTSGISMAEYIRRALAQYSKRQARKAVKR
jgi:predicted HicB family RNase H-like nuclease